MSNSRKGLLGGVPRFRSAQVEEEAVLFRAATPTPRSTNRGEGRILENVYKPGFIDITNLESLRMSLDREFGEISRAVFKTGNKTNGAFGEIQGVTDELKKALEEIVKRVDDNYIVLNKKISAVEAGYKTADAVLRAGLDEEVATRTKEVKDLQDILENIKPLYGAVVEDFGITKFQLMNGSGKEIMPKFNMNNFQIGDQGEYDTVFDMYNAKPKIKPSVIGDMKSDNFDKDKKTGWEINRDGTVTMFSPSISVSSSDINFSSITSSTIQDSTVNGSTLSNCIIGKTCTIEATITGDLDGANITNATISKSTLEAGCIIKAPIDEALLIDSPCKAFVKAISPLTMTATNQSLFTIAITKAKPYDRYLSIANVRFNGGDVTDEVTVTTSLNGTSAATVTVVGDSGNATWGLKIPKDTSGILSIDAKQSKGDKKVSSRKENALCILSKLGSEVF
ncbi:hypothetical protein PQC38_gp113 [Aeromonas phage BUCT695]|uniref:hypothetical protein n=1 Tax=Aeromonas phage BUCT695 TaxID=2908630 RepID=UPI00232995EE|nr:hypothetical protein PQC38_gp113 [Aeromonas phage BUCT695]UIW10589.1 hypothetical protein [Aeromonas phage BUCT695]